MCWYRWYTPCFPELSDILTEVCTHCSYTFTVQFFPPLASRLTSPFQWNSLHSFHLLNALPFGLLRPPPLCSIWPGFPLLYPWSSLFWLLEDFPNLAFLPPFSFFFCHLHWFFLLSVIKYGWVVFLQSCKLWPLRMWLWNPWKPICVAPPVSEGCIFNSWNSPYRHSVARSYSCPEQLLPFPTAYFLCIQPLFVAVTFTLLPELTWCYLRIFFFLCQPPTQCQSSNPVGATT